MSTLRLQTPVQNIDFTAFTTTRAVDSTIESRNIGGTFSAFIDGTNGVSTRVTGDLPTSNRAIVKEAQFFRNGTETFRLEDADLEVTPSTTSFEITERINENLDTLLFSQDDDNVSINNVQSLVNFNDIEVRDQGGEDTFIFANSIDNVSIDVQNESSFRVEVSGGSIPVENVEKLSFPNAGTFTLSEFQNREQNDAPSAVDDSATTQAGQAVEVDVLANDSDRDGDNLSVTNVTDAGNGSASIRDDGIVRYTPQDGFTGADSFTYTVSDGNGATATGQVSVTVEEPEEPEAEAPVNTLILSGVEQTIGLTFDAEVRGTAEAETIQVRQGTTLANFGAGAGDRIALPDAISAYSFTPAGNTLTITNSTAGTAATIALNGQPTLAFADGGATASIDASGGSLALTVGGQAVGPGFDPSAVALDPEKASTFGDTSGSSSDGFPELPSQGGPSLDTFGTASSQNIDGNQTGTVSGAGGEDRFVFDTGRRADLTIDDFENGDQLFFNIDQLGDLSVNNNDFTDGQVTLSAGEAVVTLTNLPNTTDQQIFDPTSFETQFGNSGIGLNGAAGGDPASGDNEDSTGLPALPSDGGPAPVGFGTSASENIDGNQDGTVSGSGGDDRFMFDTDRSADLTIDDFENGDQLFFQGIDSVSEIGVSNARFDDGEVTLIADRATVTLTNVGDADAEIFNASRFQSAFGDDALGFA